MSQAADPAGFQIVQAVQEFSRAGGTETVAFELQQAWEADGTHASVLAAIVGPDVPAAARTRIRFALPTIPQRIPTRGRWRHAGRSALIPAYTIAASIALRRGLRNAGWAQDAVVLSHDDSFVADVVVLHAVNAANLAQKRLDKEWRWALNPLHLWVGARDRLMLRGLRARRYVAVSNRVVGELERFHGVPRDRIAVIANGTDIVLSRRTGLAPDYGMRSGSARRRRCSCSSGTNSIVRAWRTRSPRCATRAVRRRIWSRSARGDVARCPSSRRAWAASKTTWWMA